MFFEANKLTMLLPVSEKPVDGMLKSVTEVPEPVIVRPEAEFYEPEMLMSALADQEVLTVIPLKEFLEFVSSTEAYELSDDVIVTPARTLLLQARRRSIDAYSVDVRRTAPSQLAEP